MGGCRGGLERGWGCWRKNGGAGERVWGPEEGKPGERMWGVSLLILHLSISMGSFRNDFLHRGQAVLSAVTCCVR